MDWIFPQDMLEAAERHLDVGCRNPLKPWSSCLMIFCQGRAVSTICQKYESGFARLETKRDGNDINEVVDSSTFQGPRFHLTPRKHRGMYDVESFRIHHRRVTLRLVRETFHTVSAWRRKRWKYHQLSLVPYQGWNVRAFIFRNWQT